jgi:hypothetical protein
MNDELHGWLDGDLDGRDLDEATRAQAEVWDRVTASLRGEAPGPAPAWIETRVMAEVRARAHRPAAAPWWTWWLRPRTIRLSPLVVAGAAAALALAVAWPRGSTGPLPDPAVGEPAPVVYVQFMLEAPEARTVAVSGDFNQWAGDAAMDDLDGDGVWTLRVPLEPGVHEYMFVIDGERWVTDPLAERYSDDGFGGQNAVLAVPSPGRSS